MNTLGTRYRFYVGDLLEKSTRFRTLLLLTPALTLVAAFFILPVLAMVRISFYYSTRHAVYLPGFTFESYLRFLTDPWYLGMMWRTVQISVAVTLLVFALGYPLAYGIWRAKGRKKAFLMAAVLLPLFTSLIARLYGWMLILSKSGPIDLLLVKLDIIHQPVLLNFNFYAVVGGLTYTTIPYLILILMSVLEGIDGSLLEVANNLGAGRLRAFLEVVFPLSLPGIIAGSIVAFVWAMGALAEPLILGSPREWMLGVESQRQILSNFDWPFGAAIAFILVVLILIVLLIFQKFMKRQQ